MRGKINMEDATMIINTDSNETMVIKPLQEGWIADKNGNRFVIEIYNNVPWYKRIFRHGSSIELSDNNIKSLIAFLNGQIQKL